MIKQKSTNSALAHYQIVAQDKETFSLEVPLELPWKTWERVFDPLDYSMVVLSEFMIDISLGNSIYADLLIRK